MALNNWQISNRPPAFDKLKMYGWLAALQCVNHDDQTKFAQVLDMMGGTAPTWRAASADTPPVAAARFDTDAVLFIGGTQNFEQWRGNISGRAAIPCEICPGDAHRYFLEVAVRAMTFALGYESQFTTRPKWLLCGHSLGGAAATIVGKAYYAIDRTLPLGVISTGSPRVGNPVFARANGPNHWRITNANDIIPTLPSAFESVAFDASWGARHINRRIAYMHDVIARGLLRSGRFRDADAPLDVDDLIAVIGTDDQATLLAAYFTAVHQLGETLRRIDLSMAGTRDRLLIVPYRQVVSSLA